MLVHGSIPLHPACALILTSPLSICGAGWRGHPISILDIDRMRRSKKRSRRRGSLEARLTDDLVVEILHRLPAKSLYACRCVSPRWRDLISDPDHRKKLPQILTGFFYMSVNRDRFPMVSRHFTNILRGEGSSISPSLRFLATLALPPAHLHLGLLQWPPPLPQPDAMLQGHSNTSSAILLLRSGLSVLTPLGRLICRLRVWASNLQSPRTSMCLNLRNMRISM